MQCDFNHIVYQSKSKGTTIQYRRDTMKNIKRTIVALGMAVVMAFSTGVVAMAAEYPSGQETKDIAVQELVEMTNNVAPQADWVNFDTVTGSLSAIATKGNIYVDKGYSEVIAVVAGRRVDGSSNVATYDVKLTQGKERRDFTMSLDGEGHVNTLGKLAKGTWSYEITRSSGSGEYAYVINFYGR